MLYALLHKDKLIGLYNNYTSCNHMLVGLVNNKFAKHNVLKIVNYHDNSITIAEELFISENIVESDSETESDTETLSTEKLDDKTQQQIKNTRDKKSKIEYNMNLLKKKKETIEESKNIYKIDYELFTKFKKFKAENSNFEIPELFHSKYNLMIKLELDNNLNWETFYQQYKTQPFNTSYDTIFDSRSNERKLFVISSSEDNTDLDK